MFCSLLGVFFFSFFEEREEERNFAVYALLGGVARRLAARTSNAIGVCSTLHASCDI